MAAYRRMLGLLICCLAAVSCGGEARRPSTVTVTGAVVEMSPTTADLAFAYLTITTDADDELIEITVPSDVASSASYSPPAGTVTVGGHIGHLDGEGAPDHTHDARLAIPAGQPLALAPGAGALRLDGLRSPLSPGGTVELTLRFASGATTKVLAVVSPP